MKSIFKNYGIFKILILILAAILVLTVSSSLSENNKVSAETLSIATVNAEPNAENETAIEAFLSAVESLPDVNNLEYKHKSLLEDAKKKYNALTEEDGAKHKESLNEAQKRYDKLSDEEKQNAKILRAEITYKTIHEKFSSRFIVLESLTTLGKGMLGIFVVMSIMIGSIYLLTYADNKKKKIKEEVIQ